MDVLATLFQQVVIPEQVRAELDREQTPQVVRDFVHNAPEWLVVQKAPSSPQLPGIDAGEAAAIQLALSRGLLLVLMDDWDGRRVARSRGLRVIGTIGVLEQAAVENLLSLPEAIERVKQTDFRGNAQLLQEALDRDARRRGLS